MVQIKITRKLPLQMDLNFHQPRILPGDLHQKSLSRQCLLKRLVRVSKTPATTYPLRPAKQKQKLSNISSALKSEHCKCIQWNLIHMMKNCTLRSFALIDCEFQHIPNCFVFSLCLKFNFHCTQILSVRLSESRPL